MKGMRGWRKLAGWSTVICAALIQQAAAQAPAPAKITVGSQPQAVAADVNSNIAVVTNSGDSSLSFIDLTSQKVVATTTGIASPAGVACSALELAVVASKTTNSVAIVDVTTRRVRTTLAVGSAPVAVAVNPFSNVAVVANSQSFSISIIDLSAMRVVGAVDSIPSPTGIQAVAIDPDLNVAAVASSSTNTLYIVDLVKRQITARILVGASPSGVAIDRQSKTAVVSNEGGGSVSFVDLTTNSVRATVTGIYQPQAVAIATDTRSALVTTGRNGTLEVVSLTTAGSETSVSSLPGASGVAFDSATGRTIVALTDLNSAAVFSSLGLFSMVNAASFVPGAVAPLSIVSGFGSNLADGTVAAAGVPLPAVLQNVSVRVNNVPAPLFFVSPAQINFQIPQLGAGTYRVQVLKGSAVIASGSVAVAPAAPALFTENQQGTGQAVALNEDGRRNGPAPPAGVSDTTARRPAHAGEVVQLFGTGGGVTSPVAEAGAAAAAAAPTLLSATAQVGGIRAEVLYSGASPGLVGVWQVNVRVPSSAPTGSAVPVVVTVNNKPGNTVMVAIE
jgi:uncharacterized protein (TIGR03437 family)